jgi:hypothetical protein
MNLITVSYLYHILFFNSKSTEEHSMIRAAFWQNKESEVDDLYILQDDPKCMTWRLLSSSLLT